MSNILPVLAVILIDQSSQPKNTVAQIYQLGQSASVDAVDAWTHD